MTMEITYEYGVAYDFDGYEGQPSHVEIAGDEQDARAWAQSGGGTVVRQAVKPIVGPWEVI